MGTGTRGTGAQSEKPGVLFFMLFRLGQAEICKPPLQARDRLSLGHPQAFGPISTKLYSYRYAMVGASLPMVSVPVGPVHGASPPMPSVLGCTIHVYKLAHAGLAAPSIQQPGPPWRVFPQSGYREKCVLQLHIHQGLQVWWWRCGSLCALHRGRRPGAMFLQCQLSGLWRNEQDSLMEISAVRSNGEFHGKYLTRVTLSGSCARLSPLKGTQQQPGEGEWPTFTFTVHWDKFSSKCWDIWGWLHGDTVCVPHRCPAGFFLPCNV